MALCANRRPTWKATRSVLLVFLATILGCTGWILFLRHVNNEKEESISSGSEGEKTSPSEDGGTEEEGEPGGEGEGVEGEGGEGEQHTEGEVEVDRFTVFTAGIVIILVLILITILFEKAKEAIEKMADKTMKPAVQSLFGELTVLGFLSVGTFLLVQAGVFNDLSMKIFGEKELLVELFEKIHYILFFVMINFLAHVLRLLYQSSVTMKDWTEMEQKCTNEYYMDGIVKKDPKERKHSEKLLLLYYNLRQEFILNRSVEPPFLPTSSHPLPSTFNFAAYLYANYGKSCCKVVEVETLSWFFFMVCTVIFYGIAAAVDMDHLILSWIWLGCGWLLMVVAIAFSYYLDRIKRAYTPMKYEQRSKFMESINLNLDEETQSFCSASELVVFNGPAQEQALTQQCGDALPRWCQIDLEKYLAKRSWLTKKILPHEPTRQDALYWFEKEGHEFHLMFFQIGLMSVDIYLAVLIVMVAYLEFNHWETFVYILVAIAPFMVIIGNSRRQMGDLTIVGSMGSHRNPVAVAQVIREEKTAHAIRAFLVLETMHRAAQGGFRASATHFANNRRASTCGVVMEEATVEVLSKTFDAFDGNGTGHITYDELTAMMQKFGASGSNIQGLIAALDRDQDGYVTKDEFIRWYSKCLIEEEEITLQDRARNLFELFDKNGDGEIGLEEFQMALDAFNMGFTIDEIGMIVTEMNEDGGVWVRLEQFQELVEKFYPEEMEWIGQNSSRNNMPEMMERFQDELEAEMEAQDARDNKAFSFNSEVSLTLVDARNNKYVSRSTIRSSEVALTLVEI